MTRWPREIVGGLLLVAVGIAFLVPALGYGLGSLARMRAGNFPAIISVALMICGLIIAVTGLKTSVPWQSWSLRPLVTIIASGVLFAALIRGFGLIPAVAATTIASSVGDKASTLTGTLLLALAVVAFSVVVFTYALGLNIPLFRIP